VAFNGDFNFGIICVVVCHMSVLNSFKYYGIYTYHLLYTFFPQSVFVFRMILIINCDQLTLSIFGVKNAWSYTVTPLYGYKA
jgi:hypothetical protein